MLDAGCRPRLEALNGEALRRASFDGCGHELEAAGPAGEISAGGPHGRCGSGRSLCRFFIDQKNCFLLTYLFTILRMGLLSFYILVSCQILSLNRLGVLNVLRRREEKHGVA